MTAVLSKGTQISTVCCILIFISATSDLHSLPQLPQRHCPKCQAAASKQWLAEREAELLPVPYFHLVFTLPPAIGDIAYQNKAVIYELVFKAASQTRAHNSSRSKAHG